MIKEPELIIRTVNDADRSQLSHIINFGSFVHRHLDWRPPLDWIGHSPYYVIEKNRRIISAIACPPDPKEVSWIRVFAAKSKISVNKAWDLLWPQTKDSLIELGAKSVVAIPLHDWFKEILIQNDFVYVHNVVILVWDSEKLSLLKENSSYSIRTMLPEDLINVQSVDELAFGPIWRNSVETLKLAYNQALVASVAEDQNGKILGYQISTPSPFGAHLARLAVLPEAQGLGIGYKLTHHVQSMFQGRISTRVSVNTQDNNFASLALYEKAGFNLTGESYPVYQFNLE